MGYLPPQTLYSSNVALTLSATSILFPLHLSIKRNSAEAAIAEAKTIVEAIAAEVTQHRISGGQLRVLELNGSSKQEFITITPESKNSVQLQINFLVELATEQTPDFWRQAEMIAKSLDYLRGLPDTITRKETSLSLGTALFPGEAEELPF